jgi:hypothetical protein
MRKFYASTLPITPHDSATVQARVALYAQPKHPWNDPAMIDAQFCTHF